MQKIEVKVLNPEILTTIRQMCVCAARLTQRADTITCMDDFMELYNKSHKDTTYETMVNLSHNTIQRYGKINVVITGASRRFLAQITRNKTGVDFMSGSLQYSNYSNDADFCVPYEITEAGDEAVRRYLDSCNTAMASYREMNATGINHDACGFMAPQGLRNVLIISANPVAFKNMISQRMCNRNSKETQYVMLKVWEELYKLDPILFSPQTTGCACMQRKGCEEGRMACGMPIAKGTTPTEILDKLYPLIRGTDNES